MSSTNVNNVNLFNQMQSMVALAEGNISDSQFNASAFSDIYHNALKKVSDLSDEADALKTRFEFNDPEVSIADVMMSSQKANIGLEATMRVRNKIVQAYQDIMNMPV